MHTLIAHRRRVAVARGGFTLVEMLVATTLVVMMMLMFAQIYVAAIGSLGEQQANARNDGKARLADILLRGDLQKGSFRAAPNSGQGIVPLVRDDVVNQWQKGFVYLSTNDQTNPVDDVLHFTTYMTRGVRNRDPSYYYGRCQPVDGVLEYNASPSDVWEFPNHPDLDDGDTSNQVGMSRAAEVVYFVRGGNLYRRILLLRDTDLGGVLALNSAQPSTALAAFSGRIIPANTVTTPSYYKAFDYSAYCRVTDDTDPTTDSVQFLGIDALDNRADAPDSLGRSMTRFGFGITAANQVAVNGDATVQSITRVRGRPVEFDSAGNFFGRPLQAETGSYQWGWPGTGSNPLLSGALAYNTTSNRLSVGGTVINDPDTANSRESEDLLLSNVEAFMIEVWDQGLTEDLDGDGVLDGGEDLNNNGYLDQSAGFVQLGNTALSTGYFRSAQRLNPAYGPGEYDVDGDGTFEPSEDRNGNGTQDFSSVFDTGHPDMWTDAATRTSVFKPPYRPLLYRLTEDTNRNVTLDMGEDFNGNGNLDLPVFPVKAADIWTASSVYRSGSEDQDNDGTLDPGEDSNGNGVLDRSGDVVFRPGDTTFSVGYRCVASGEDVDGDGVLDAAEVDSNMSGGAPELGEDLNNNGQFDPGEDLPDAMSGNGLIDWGVSGTSAPLWPTVPGLRVVDGGVTWEAFDNRVGLQKIRITVRVRDPIEGLSRQFSIVHSFVNPED